MSELDIDDVAATSRLAKKQLAELRADADRYRWLRDVASGDDWEHIGQTTEPRNTDARIDELMALDRPMGGR